VDGTRRSRRPSASRAPISSRAPTGPADAAPPGEMPASGEIDGPIAPPLTAPTPLGSRKRASRKRGLGST
jgi:hypothetical protein